MSTRPLTDQQDTVLTFITRFVQEHGFPPTLREIGDAIGLANGVTKQAHAREFRFAVPVMLGVCDAGAEARDDRMTNRRPSRFWRVAKWVVELIGIFIS